MYNRDDARAIRNKITSYYINTKYHVVDGKLYVTVPGGIKEEQFQLIVTHRDDLITLFTTPPAPGRCVGGHDIDWRLSKFGVWLCSCYWKNEPDARKLVATVSKRQP